jgi:ubiquinone/menaquinone biosynthesis C-methylase UbiE
VVDEWRPDAARPLVVDVGAGTARVPLVLAGAWRDCVIVAVDRAIAMLRVATRNVRDAGLDRRIICPQADARQLPFHTGAAPFVISNSLIHHIPDPPSVLMEMCRVAAPGALLFVRDLFRPATGVDVERLVSTYGAYETPAQRALFAASLRAALTVEEIRALAERLPLTDASVVASSDRHWTLVATCRG